MRETVRFARPARRRGPTVQRLEGLEETWGYVAVLDCQWTVL